MNQRLKDPLILFSRIAVVLVKIAIVIGLAVTSYITVRTIGNPEEIQRQLNEIGQATDYAAIEWAILARVAAHALTMLGAFGVAHYVGKVIATLKEGDPFIARNVSYLMRMGWLALAIQFFGIVTEFLNSWLDPRFDDRVLIFRSQFSLTGLGLALVLFILARVFKQGAAMRDDLKGTV